MFACRAHQLRIDAFGMMLQHLNSSFSVGFPQSHVNNETPIKTQSWERDKRCHLLFTNCIPHSFSSSLHVSEPYEANCLIDWQSVDSAWWGEGVGEGAESSSCSYIPLFPHVSRPSISTAVMAVRKLIAGGIGCAALQTYAMHYLSFHASSWRAFFCTHPHILPQGGPGKGAHFLQFV